MVKLLFSRKDPPIGGILSCNVAGVPFNWCSETQLVLDDNVSLTTSQSISRHVARLNPAFNLYPADILQRTQVDHWLSVSSKVGYGASVKPVLTQLNTALVAAHCLVPPHTTIADYELFAALHRSSDWHSIAASGEAPQHVLRWYNSMLTQVSPILASLPPDVKAGQPTIAGTASAATTSKSAADKGSASKKSGKREEGGKFVELPDAKMGEVVVRFPPEASGYLHIGHAKAALLNQHYQLAFKGKLIMRFDDTNPAKEDAHFEKVILDDLKLLQVYPDTFTHTSDYFDLMLELCEKLIKSGTAYVDDTDGETMKAEREERKDSKNRLNTVEKNLAMWEGMKTATESGQKCAVRAKIDMNSNNGCMRDPTIYRCKAEPHIRTGTKYKVYPTYDFACPIVDSIEGVTHALRTTEYHDRDEQFFWFLDKLELRRLHIYEYSRLNMNNTVLSKRKLTWFVEQGLVDGWDDPRFPTVRGILRRGMTVEGLKEFIIAQGSSRSVVNMEWDKIWSFNKKVIDAVAPRCVALLKDTLVPVNVVDAVDETKNVQKHPKNPSIGLKTVRVGPKVLIESEDAELLKEGENATFINWGNILIKKINRQDGKVVSVDAESNTSNTDYKKTLKVTWLIDNSMSPLTPVVCVYFDHLINKGVLSKEEDFKSFIGHETRFESEMLGEDDLKLLNVGDIIQLQRKGFFKVDEPYKEATVSNCKESPVVLFSIPDGHTKDTGVSAMVKKSTLSTKEAAQSAKGKVAEKSPLEEAKPVVAAAAVAGSTEVKDIHYKIKEQGDKIRKLKSEKADKNVISSEVAVLKELKQSFNAAAGFDWTPNIDESKFGATTATKAAETAAPKSCKAGTVHLNIVEQGNIIRNLKSNKADKVEVTAAVAVLLALKKEFKEIADMDWTPNIDASQFAEKSTSCVATPEPTPPAAPAGSSAIALHQTVVDQGNVVRTLKANKAAKAEVTAAVGALLAAKKEFKEATGVEWTPSIDVSQFAAKISTATITVAAPAPPTLTSAPTPTFAPTPPTSVLPPHPTSAPSVAENDAASLHQKIVDEGNAVRNLKSSKADKAAVTAAVSVLLDLKKQFKESTGTDWTPTTDVGQLKSTEPTPAASEVKLDSGSTDALVIHQQIVDQGNVVRTLKSDKADKTAINSAVEVLLKLKLNFKGITKLDWKPNIDTSKLPQSPSCKTDASSSAPPAAGDTALELNSKIKLQGEKVRELKSASAEKSVIKGEVTALLALKQEFKAATNVDWKPDIDISQFGSSTAAPSVPAESSNEDLVTKLNTKVKEQGDKIRQLKSASAEKSVIKSQVDVLLSYKKEFKEALGYDWKPEMSLSQATAKTPSPCQSKSISKPKEVQQQPKKEEYKPDDSKKKTRLGLEVAKQENLSEWYSQVITKSEMIEYYNVSGCYILRPWSYGIWELIKDFVDAEIKKLGIENAYFPLFVSKDVLEKEKSHIADFSPEVAWVTRSGNTELAEPIAIRPTSETVMYPAFAKWIQSHRDLPLRINQWNNVVRWEFKQPTPFLRTREFLWQEGHTAFATQVEATTEVLQILDIYARVYEDLLAVPVVKGKKTEKEKFAGGDFTTTTEAFVSASGRGIQGATSHHLGQNFSKMFEIMYEDPVTQERQFVYQNSWGMTTRTIGVMVLVHGDNKGLVLPPKVAAIQAIIMPVGITLKVSEAEKNELYDACKKLEAELIASGIRTKADLRDNVTPAWKFNHWELKGVPLRLELGPREVASGEVFVVRRDNGEKKAMSRSTIETDIKTLLSTIHSSMLDKAREDLNSHKIMVSSWDEFCKVLDEGNMLLAPFCGIESCEDAIKKGSARDRDVEPGAPSMGAKSLCIPFQQPQVMPSGTACIHPSCNNQPQYYCMFGRSY